jgi:hypothetical protein
MSTNLPGLLEKKGIWQFWGAIVLGLSLILSTYFVTATIIKQKKLERVVAVKGLAEQIVKSDRATWDINFTSNNDNLAQAYQGITHAQEVTRNFLMKEGFKPEDIEIIPISIIDNQGNNYASTLKVKRYAANSGISVKTGAVDLVTSSVQKVGALVQAGVVISSSNVRFMFTQLNTIKTAMLITATDSARSAGKAFAENSHSKLGEISMANQGLFTIESANGNAYDDSSIMKKVRVVTSVSYYLN